MEHVNTEIPSQNKYTSPIHKIALLGIIGVMVAAWVYAYEYSPTLSLEQIEQRRVAEMLEAQTQIDKDNLKTLSDCHDIAEKEARYPDEYLVIRSECYEKWKKPDILKGSINADGEKIYPWMSSGATDSSAPWRSSTTQSWTTHVKTSIVYEKENSWATSSKREADASQVKSPRTGIPGISIANANQREDSGSTVRAGTWAAYSSTHTSQKGEQSLLSVLSLDRCRITQTEDQHIQKSSGHIYGTDIACEKWESFTVVVPYWKKSYTVKSVGHDKRLGNYIVLENGVYMFVFAHTQSAHKVGDTVYPGHQLGYTDDSGLATNVHLHFELWRQGYNITHEEMLGRWSRWNDLYSYKLLVQRGWYTGLSEATKFTRSVECPNGYALDAYEDPKGSWNWSIGCGTKSYAGERISKSEAERRFAEELESRLEWVYTQRLWLSTNERSALTAFFYNLWYNRPEFIQAVRARNSDQLEKIWKAHNQPFPKGLGIRRDKEWRHWLGK